jgi:hypothetical protein
MLRIADTTIRMYRKKNGGISYRLRTFLLVATNTSFSLGAYLKHIGACLTLPNGNKVPLDVTYSVDTIAEYSLETMTHRFIASGEADTGILRNSVGKLRLDYHLSFTGHPYEEPKFFEMVVPLVVKTNNYTGQ